MHLTTYEKVVEACGESLQEQSYLTPSDASRLCVPFESLQSLRSQMHSRLVRRTDHLHKRRRAEYTERWRGGETVQSLARHVQYPPYLMARLILEGLYNFSAKRVKELVRDPALIDNERLQVEVRHALKHDLDYSVHMDQVRRTVGMEYEFILQQELRARGVPFETESSLRTRGAYKTPDVRLIVPMAMKGPTGSWHVITWMDSKAMFGDLDTFEREHLEQLESYVNRYGPGAVIYWFGFVDICNSSDYPHHHKDILVASKIGKTIFPSDLTHMG